MNDEYFGSDFAKIHKVIDMLFDQGYLPIKCADFVRALDLVNDFDDGNWETAYEDWQPQADRFKYINICFAIHTDSPNRFAELFPDSSIISSNDNEVMNI